MHDSVVPISARNTVHASIIMNHQPPLALPKDRRADQLHDVADRRGRRPAGRRVVTTIEIVVGGEILEQVAEAALNQQRKDDRLGDVPFGVLRLFTHRGDRFETH